MTTDKFYELWDAWGQEPTPGNWSAVQTAADELGMSIERLLQARNRQEAAS